MIKLRDIAKVSAESLCFEITYAMEEMLNGREICIRIEDENSDVMDKAIVSLSQEYGGDIDEKSKDLESLIKDSIDFNYLSTDGSYWDSAESIIRQLRSIAKDIEDEMKKGKEAI
jgi:hypothetical protein